MNVFSEQDEFSSLPTSVKAMWISQFDMTLMCQSKGQGMRDRESYTSRVVLMMAKLRMMGFNTIFVQVRPNADSLYPSSLFPPSAYAVGEAEDFSYDPFGILVEEAARATLAVHAWINPMRAMATTSRAAKNSDYPVGRWIAEGSPYVRAVDGYYYLDPAYKQVRELFCDGAREVLSLYAVDGLIIDDYFYPTTDKSFDTHSYGSYQAKGGTASLADFRRQNTQALVTDLQKAAHDCGALFGVSPSGNTERNYNELYADVATWCQNGLCDYLCPQVYFGLEHETRPFTQVAQEFSDMVMGTDTNLILCMTLEKAAQGYAEEIDVYAGTGQDEWIENRDVLLRCLQQAEQTPLCCGVAYFSYRLFYSPADGSEYLPTAEEREHWLPYFRDITFLKKTKNRQALLVGFLW